MKLERLAALGEIISSIAILVTLVYLAVQTAQTTAAIQADTRQESFNTAQTLLLYVASNPEIDEYYYKAELTDLEKRRLSAFLTSIVAMFQNRYMQYLSGSMDEQTWVAGLGAFVDTFSKTRTRRWWNNYVASGTKLDRGFSEEMSRLLAETPTNDVQSHIAIFD